MTGVAGAGLWGARRQSSLQADMVRLNALVKQVTELRFLDNDINGWQGYVWGEVVQWGVEYLDGNNPDTSRYGLLASKAQVLELLDSLPEAQLTEASDRLAADATDAAGQAATASTAADEVSGSGQAVAASAEEMDAAIAEIAR
ncbi:hypothetical protein, partial [Couchioplanes caeruleus]|uniref:hypothetical protein n=1 Tax=Couchioplanes caeruleus TaxID=56438 RepID=UPI000A8C97ED